MAEDNISIANEGINLSNLVGEEISHKELDLSSFIEKKVEYLSLGLGLYDSDTLNDGFEFIMEIGVKTDSFKIYLNLDSIFFEEKNIETYLTMYSLGYDYFFQKKNILTPYIGLGVNYIDIETINIITNEEKEEGTKFGMNANAGLLFDLDNSFSINAGIKYIKINHELINYSYGYFIKFEFSR